MAPGLARGTRLAWVRCDGTALVTLAPIGTGSAGRELLVRYMPRRYRQILLVTSILWVSWLTTMLVHECGHVLGAVATSGEVRRVVWHPAVMSRTDVRPNPRPLIEVSAGPIFGSAFPLAIAISASLMGLRIAYLLWVIAGFCLIANGAYIGIGAHPPNRGRSRVGGTWYGALANGGVWFACRRGWILDLASCQSAARFRPGVRRDQFKTCVRDFRACCADDGGRNRLRRSGHMTARGDAGLTFFQERISTGTLRIGC